jgi:hypothetical protein
MRLLERLLERGLLEAFARLYPDVHASNPAFAIDFATALMCTWWMAEHHAPTSEEGSERLPPLKAAVDALVDAEAQYRFPAEYAIGGQVREDVRDETFDYFWSVSRRALVHAEADRQLDEALMYFTQKGLAYRRCSSN